MYRSDRRKRDYEMMRAAALREFGRRNYGLILFGPVYAWGLLAVAVLVGGWWAWTYVDHERIAQWVGAAGVLCVLVWMAWYARTGATLHRRLMSAASGINRRGGHLVGASGALLILAALMMWRPLW